MELSLPHTLHLFNVFRENKDSDNCAQVLEEEVYRMFGTKYLNDEHYCNDEPFRDILPCNFPLFRLL